jgi:hypothetical protein
MSLRWDPVEDAAGYRLYYGTRSGVYTGSVVVTNGTYGVIDGLDDCREYFVAVKAYNGAGESAEFSNEISGWSKPEIDRIDPGGAAQGARFTLNLRGGGFASSADLSWDAASIPSDLLGNPLLRLENARVVSCSQIQLLATVEPSARGFRAMPVGDLLLRFQVTNPDGFRASGSAVLQVGFDVRRADINRSDASTTDRVDGQDLSWLAYAYGTAEGAPSYSPDADLNGDGLVDGEDLALLSPGFGKCWSGTTWTAAACP